MQQNSLFKVSKQRQARQGSSQQKQRSMARRQIVSGNANPHQMAVLKASASDTHATQQALPPKRPKQTNSYAKAKPPKVTHTQPRSTRPAQQHYAMPLPKKGKQAAQTPSNGPL